MGLQDLIKRHAAGVFCGANSFAELVTWTASPGAAPQTFRALVFRRTPEPPPGGAPAPAPVIEIFVPNSTDPAAGVSSVDKGGARVAVADRQGGAAAPRSVVAILQQDAGGWLLKLG